MGNSSRATGSDPAGSGDSISSSAPPCRTARQTTHRQSDGTGDSRRRTRLSHQHFGIAHLERALGLWIERAVIKRTRGNLVRLPPSHRAKRCGSELKCAKVTGGSSGGNESGAVTACYGAAAATVSTCLGRRRPRSHPWRHRDRGRSPREWSGRNSHRVRTAAGSP